MSKNDGKAGFGRKRIGGSPVSTPAAHSSQVAMQARRKRSTGIAVFALTAGALGLYTYNSAQTCQTTPDPNNPQQACSSSRSGSGHGSSGGRRTSSSSATSGQTAQVAVQRGGFGRTGSSFSSGGG
jgi:hypothetical protein